MYNLIVILAELLADVSLKMALQSTKLYEDPHVEFVTIAMKKYLHDYIEFLEKGEDGIEIFIKENKSAHWHSYVEHYALTIKHFGLNPAYKRFEKNRELLIQLLEEEKTSIDPNYKKEGRSRRFSIFE